jgi:predicted phosphoribosyltransferase
VDMARRGICACKFFSKETLRPVTLQRAAEAGGVVVAHEIRLELDVTVLRKLAAPPTP